MEEIRKAFKILVRKPEGETTYLEDLIIAEKIILKYILSM
jgi:hypothetical protein